ncbi:class I SAM-dependent methyltransferase [Candidatus Babeliales bacterium]|nr:class I SAM-dependent methyltransferase [Candidatus Babeliales bacterium]
METKVYYTPEVKNSEQAAAYSKTQGSVMRYIAFRDVPALIKHYVRGTKALDYGSGTGCSAKLLLELGMDVVGVDISEEMLAQARLLCPETEFHLSNNGIIPASDKTFDLVLSGFVMFCIATQAEVVAYLQEAKRVMKSDGVFIAVTGSQDLFSKDWLTLNIDFPENKNLVSGAPAKAYHYESNIEFTDYYWTEQDYRNFFAQAGFELLEVHYPLGKASEPYAWKDEKTHSPFVVFVARAL